MIKEKFDLSGKLALVVGGRGFLGRRFAAALDEFGASVYAADLATLSPAAKKDAGSAAPESDSIQQLDVDVTDEESVRALIRQVAGDRGRIDILVYAAT